MLELLQTATQERWWEHTGETFIGGAVPVIIWMLENRRRARKQVVEEQQKVRDELDIKHQENTHRLDSQDEKLDELLNERKYIPSHGHRETSGPLTGEGLIHPPRDRR